MREDASGRRQRAVMATDAEWERIGRAAAESGMDLSRFVIHRALDWDPLPAEVLRRAVREMLVLARLEERRLRGAGTRYRKGLGGRLRHGGRMDRAGGHAGGADRSWRGEPLESGGAGRGGRAVTEAAARSGRRQRSLHCKPAEQAMIRERAAAADKTVSRYVMELALADDPDRHPLVLSEEEQAELRDGVRELQAFVLALRRELPGGSGLSLLSAVSVIARERAP